MLHKYLITLEQSGPVHVHVEGNLRTSQAIFLTLHDVGASYQSWLRFTALNSMKEVMKKVAVLHVSMPGQNPGAEDLDSAFPSLDMLGMEMVTVLDTLGVNNKAVIVMGEGAGADIATRFAMNYPSRVWGVVLIHSRRNMMMSGLNVKKYDESYRKKEVWSMKMSTETLILVGAKTKP